MSWQRHDGFVLVAAPSPWPPAGVAPAGAAESLRTALLQGFAEDADVVVCDLAPGPVDGAVDVVTGVARRVSAWPGALLVVVTPDRYAIARLHPAAGAGLQLAADRNEAEDLVRRRPPRLQTRGRLEPALRA